MHRDAWDGTSVDVAGGAHVERHAQSYQFPDQLVVGGDAHPMGDPSWLKVRPTQKSPWSMSRSQWPAAQTSSRVASSNRRDMGSLSLLPVDPATVGVGSCQLPRRAAKPVFECEKRDDRIAFATVESAPAEARSLHNNRLTHSQRSPWPNTIGTDGNMFDGSIDKG